MNSGAALAKTNMPSLLISFGVQITHENISAGLPEIVHDASNSTYSVLTKSAKGGDDKHGLNTYAVVVDELHVITDATALDTLETSTGSRDQPKNVSQVLR